MLTKREKRLIAAIDVGSNYLRMSVAEVDSSGGVNVVEDLIKPTNIGRDTFTDGRISAETMHETCEVLKGFSQIIKEYRVKNIRAVSTSGVREADNREYIIERIRLKTGLEVEIINSAEERFLTYKALWNHIGDSKYISSEPTLIVNVTSGGIEVSIYDHGSLKLTEYIKLGTLRLRETLSELENKSIDFPKVMEEYIDSKIYLLKSTIKKANIKNFIGLGGELKTIYSFCHSDQKKKDESFFLEKELLNSLYKKIEMMNCQQISDTYEISKKEAEIIQPSIILFHSFIKITQADGMYAPMTSLRNGIIYDIRDNLFELPGKTQSINDIISSVVYIAEKYGIERKHASFVEDLSLSIFDQTWKLHRIGERERLFLQVAAILHDTGNYANFSEHEVHSYNIIKTQNIMGFSNDELNLIANIARYHAYEIPSHFDENYMILGNKKKNVVSKLAAILKLAESLDISHSQKIEKLEISFGKDNAVFNIYSDCDVTLEKWDFMNNARFFEEVMGVEITIRSKR